MASGPTVALVFEQKTKGDKMPLEDFIIAVFCRVDDFLKKSGLCGRALRKRGFGGISGNIGVLCFRQLAHVPIGLGRQLACAGTIFTDEEGHITQLSNESGHYKPDVKMTLYGLEYLRTVEGLLHRQRPHLLHLN